jgi:linoleoyl-CoA desaturase
MPDHDLYETKINRHVVGSEQKMDWGESQVRNSGNFATSNKLFTECYGGINYQIEHHLFPSVCHIHYPNIKNIVKQTCNEFNITYVEVGTLYESFVSVLKNFASLRMT